MRYGQEFNNHLDDIYDSVKMFGTTYTASEIALGVAANDYEDAFQEWAEAIPCDKCSNAMDWDEDPDGCPEADDRLRDEHICTGCRKEGDEEDEEDVHPVLTNDRDLPR